MTSHSLIGVQKDLPIDRQELSTCHTESRTHKQVRKESEAKPLMSWPPFWAEVENRSGQGLDALASASPPTPGVMTDAGSASCNVLEEEDLMSLGPTG